jgi:hypothetical protein
VISLVSLHTGSRLITAAYISGASFRGIAKANNFIRYAVFAIGASSAVRYKKKIVAEAVGPRGDIAFLLLGAAREGELGALLDLSDETAMQ